MSRRRSSYSAGGKTALAIFAVIVMGLLIFCAVWTVRNWDKVKDGLNGTDLYTQEDIKNAYNDGYEDGIGDKQNFIDSIELKNTLLAEKEEEIKSLKSDVARLNSINSLYYSQIETNYSRIEELKSDAILNAEEIARLEAENVELQDRIFENENNITALETTIATYEKGLNGLKVDGVSIVTFNVDGAVVAFDMLLNGEKVTKNIPQSTENYVINNWTVNGEVIDFSTYKVNSNTCFVADITKYHTVTFYDINGVARGSSRQLDGEAITLPDYFANMDLNSLEHPDGFYAIETNSWVTKLSNLEERIDRDLSLYAFYNLAVSLHYDSVNVKSEFVTQSYMGRGDTFTAQQLGMQWGTLNDGETLDWGNIDSITTPTGNLKKFDFYANYNPNTKNINLYRISSNTLCEISFCLGWDADGNPIMPDDGYWEGGTLIKEKGITIYAEQGQKLSGLVSTFISHNLKVPEAFVGWDYDGNNTFVPSSAFNVYTINEDAIFVAAYAIDVEFVFSENDIVKTTDDSLCFVYASAYKYYNPSFPAEHAERINSSTWSLEPGGEIVNLADIDWLGLYKQEGKVTLYLVN